MQVELLQGREKQIVFVLDTQTPNENQAFANEL